MTQMLTLDTPSINELNMMRDASDRLTTMYPGYLWAVAVEGSVMNVWCANIPTRYGYTIKIPAIYSASWLDVELMRAGGEILERYSQSRSKRATMDPSLLRRDARGQAIALV